MGIEYHSAFAGYRKAMARFEIDRDYLLKTLQDLILTPSPTGDTEWAISFVEQELEEMGIPCSRTYKGALVATIPGLMDDRPRALAAHVDTLGAMVSQIKPNGRLKMTALNGLEWNSIESEGVTVQTRNGRGVRGSVVLINGAVHVNKEVKNTKRDSDTLEIRHDERTTNADETRLLGIEVGDYVYVDPRYEVGEAGFVRSRFLDDKACVACMLAAMKAMSATGITPQQRTTFLISNFEEVGHGGTDGLPDDLAELLVLDMACVGEGQNGDEYHCSICIKDSNGPYSANLTGKIRNLAVKAEVDLKPDIYPFYRSDGGAYWSSGGRAEVALIGPGVDSSHCYERTHISALLDTAEILAEYLVSE